MFKLNIKYYLILTFAIGFYLFAFIVERGVFKKWQNGLEVVNQVAEVIHKNESEIESFIDSVSYQLNSIDLSKGRFKELMRNTKLPSDDLFLYVFDNDSLVYWTDNSVIVESGDFKNVDSKQLVFVKNGWYQFFTQSGDKFNVVVLWPLRSEYSTQNIYLVNEFNPKLELPGRAIFFPDSNALATDAFTIKNSKGAFLFAIELSGEDKIYFPYYINVFYIAAIVLFYLFLYFFVSQLAQPHYLKGIAFLTGTALIPLFIKFRIPVTVFRSTVFNAELFAAGPLLDSIGHFMLWALLAAFVVSVVAVLIKDSGILNWMHRFLIVKSLVAITGIVVSLAAILIFNYGVQLLINNSKISFNFNQFHELDIYSVYGLLLICLLLFIVYQVLKLSSIIISKAGIKVMALITMSVVCIIIMFAIIFRWPFDTFQNEDQLVPVTVGSLLLIFFYVTAVYNVPSTFYQVTVLLTLLSLFASVTVYYNNVSREQMGRIALAERMENEEDVIAEFLFGNIQERLKSESIIPQIFKELIDGTLSGDDARIAITRRFSQRYIDSYWSKYQLRIKAFDSQGKLITSPDDTISDFETYLAYIDETCEPTPLQDFYNTNTDGRLGCIGILNISDIENPEWYLGTIVLDFQPKYGELVGLPLLLINDRISDDIVNTDYAFAKYENKKLKMRSGSMQFFYQMSEYIKIRPDASNNVFKNAGGWNLLFHDYAGNFSIIVAKKQDNVYLSLITIFIYLFMVMLTVYFIGFLAWHLFANNGRISLTYRRRIQLNVISVVLLSAIMLGSSTLYFIYKQYNNRLKEKYLGNLSGISLIVESELASEPDTAKEVSSDKSINLLKVASNFKTDFNIYHPDGKLQYTTQPAVFEEGLISNRMNRKALNKFTDELPSNLIQNETIGRLQYLSAYQPLYDKNNNLLAYLNIPYFRNIDEWNREVSVVIKTVFSFYAPIILVCIILTIYLTNKLSKPLKLIGNHLMLTRFGKRNETIDWKKSNDEISGLIEKYNLMVVELSRSAESLAKSEREMAWREMAKQVAHEIKNPLTPMKLSVQHLQRALNDKNADIESIINRITKTLIEQIDTLSTIATEFSDFAKMPAAQFKPVDLSNLLRGTVQLFLSETKAMVVYDIPEQPVYIYADEVQIRSVFSNLIKNATQAIPSTAEGIINIKTDLDPYSVTVRISDNGTGISDADRVKIFSPNFTTKSTGSGLGLAMVKSIIDTTGGKIWFQSQLGIGTTFYVRFQLHDATEN